MKRYAGFLNLRTTIGDSAVTALLNVPKLFMYGIKKLLVSFMAVSPRMKQEKKHSGTDFVAALCSARLIACMTAKRYRVKSAIYWWIFVYQ